GRPVQRTRTALNLIREERNVTSWYKTDLWNESGWWRWIVVGLAIPVLALTLAAITGVTGFVMFNLVGIGLTMYAFDKDYQEFAPAVGWDIRPFLYFLAFFFLPPFGQLIYLYNRYSQFQSAKPDVG
ncbi:MAG: hypothetical protein ABEI97_05320, partial [Candidatus Nanohaloarchaea archaeon]